ncbi:hypothetical protein CFC21_012708 [Triticum aestivum]|uniref:DUF1618 domain-containing protein n=2 Tax=Triticum aestivum TaxID=4565 RepID=A0A9R1DQH6_WHEAT|nr:uncharacterized protein LOC123170798 [Triticum aestivum]KAF6996363.1 hypothetical protein CFC21_012708 [Triticum aestivum]
MPLRRRLLGLSAAVSGGLRRSLATAAAHPPWVMLNREAQVVGAWSAAARLAEPPHVSELRLPEHVIEAFPAPDRYVLQLRAGAISGASGDGLLFLSVLNARFTPPAAGEQPAVLEHAHAPRVTRLVCNPLTRELSRLPDFVSDPKYDFVLAAQMAMGVLTQADRGQGPPDRFVAALLNGEQMLRFRSETGEWEAVALSPCFFPLPRPRRVTLDQETLAFGGRLWWVDLSWGALSADPFSDRPELSFVQLPRGSVLPEGAQDQARSLGVNTPFKYRRMGVSQGRLRYVEVSREEPFLLSSFVLDDEGSGWMQEHRVVLNKLWASHMSLPLQQGATTRIVLIDPVNANVVYLAVDTLAVVAVDMDREEVIGSYPYSDTACIPCVLPPWLGSSRIPSAGGKKFVWKNKTLVDVQVYSDSYYKR